MKEKIILQINNETAGTSGYYIEQTMVGLNGIDCHHSALVNRYYSFDTPHARKFFYTISERIPRSYLRKIIRYVEIYIDFRRSYYLIKKIREEYDEVIVVFSLLACLKPVLKFIKWMNELDRVRIGIIVHDATPFQNENLSLIYVNQQEILKLADFFVFHNEKTKRIVEKQFNGRIGLMYPFPLADMSIFKQKDTRKVEKKENRVTFLCLGVLRAEKGIPILRDAWKIVNNAGVKARLIIAGKNTSGRKYDFSKIRNVKYINRYLNDDEYCNLIGQCDYGVLPYIEGTNSGILSTMVAYGKPCITSDIEMFRNIPFTSEELMFTSGSAKALGEMIIDLTCKYHECYDKHRRNLLQKTKRYRESFGKEMRAEYRKVI